MREVADRPIGGGSVMAKPIVVTLLVDGDGATVSLMKAGAETGRVGGLTASELFAVASAVARLLADLRERLKLSADLQEHLVDGVTPEDVADLLREMSEDPGFMEQMEADAPTLAATLRKLVAEPEPGPDEAELEAVAGSKWGRA